MSLRRLLSPFSLLWFALIYLLSPTIQAQGPSRQLLTGPTSLLTSDSVQLYVQLAGSGIPCVFVHGGPGAGSYSFEKLGGNLLEDKLQMIYYDQRGSGRSASSARRAYSMNRMVQDLEELRQHLGLQKWVVMAHSFGGTIATAYATQHPERVQALILVNSVLNPSASLDSMMQYGLALLPATARPAANLPIVQRFGQVMGALQQQQRAYLLQYSTDSLASRASRVVATAPANHDFANQVFSGQQPTYGQDYVPVTATLQMPVLVLVGQDDHTTGATPNTFRFPKQQVVIVPGKHYSFLEQPTQFRQAVVSFMHTLPPTP